MSFEDDSFCGDAALVGVKFQDSRRPVQWLRGPQLLAKPQLFGTIKADNIIQGELGDCWLLAAMAVLADFPGHIQNLFDETSLSDHGRYTVRLHDIKSGWEEVVIDDLIPCDKRGKPLFAQVERDAGSLWVPLLEKAFAKFCGGYANLVSGYSSWAWQVLTGQPYQAWFTRSPSAEPHGGDGSTQWARWELKGLKAYQSSEEERRKWRSRANLCWKGPVERITDENMFEALASYIQANYAICCSVKEGAEVESKRPDGVICRHVYSVLQVVEVYGHQLVELRNPWGRNGEWNGKHRSHGRPDWRMPPTMGDLIADDSVKDGRFFMPWEDFCNIFGGSVSVCPVTMACARNSQLVQETGVGGGRVRCPRCRQPYTRSWVLAIDGSWHRVADGESLCFLCLRATCRSSQHTDLQVAGVHLQPALSCAPPKQPRRIKICEYGAACYRRNPLHFRECFHPSLLPPAPSCIGGCGRSAASGFETCCRRCTSTPPDLRVELPGHGAIGGLSGAYQAVPGKRSQGCPVWRQSSGAATGWLWQAGFWFFARDEALVGGRRGLVCSAAPAKSPHLVEQWAVVCKDVDGWAPEPSASVQLDSDSPTAVTHDDLCDERAEREARLASQADKLLEGWSRRRAEN